MGFLKELLKPAPHIAPLERTEEIKEKYTYWRFRIFYSMFIGYAFFYFTRKSFTFAMPSLMLELGFNKSDLGILASILAITYGISKFVNGIIADRSNPRYFMPIGLILTGMMNIFFGLSSTLSAFALFWGLNGWFQGGGWPPCARLLTHWYSQNERGSWWSSWNVSHNVGAFLIPFLIAFCIHLSGWRVAMFVPGVLCILIGFFLINRLRDTPQSLGLPPIESYRNDFGNAAPSAADERELSVKEILFKYVLSNKFMWMLGAAYCFVYVVRDAIGNWTALYLHEEKGYSLLGANGCAALFEVGGFVGSLVAGWSSDKLFGGKRGPANVIFTLGVIIGLCIFWMTPIGYTFLDSASVFLIGFFIYGPQMLIGMAAAELAHKKAAATASGFTGTFAYVGAALAGYPLAKISDLFGWNALFLTLTCCCILATLLLLPMWTTISQGAKKQPAPSPTPNLEGESAEAITQ
jgi:OPA family sugar phosphate sensor protein UhpC-like MFS transporter